MGIVYKQLEPNLRLYSEIAADNSHLSRTLRAPDPDLLAAQGECAKISSFQQDTYQQVGNSGSAIQIMPQTLMAVYTEATFFFPELLPPFIFSETGPLIT